MIRSPRTYRTHVAAALLLTGISTHAQQAAWLTGWSVNWTLNPGMPRHVLASSPGGELMTARLDGVTQLYGSDVFGGVVVHRLDPGIGQPLWSCGLGITATVDCGAVDDDGNVYVAGRFMDSLALCDGATLVHTGSGPDVDLYLIKFDPTGMPLWKRNISVAQPDASMMAALAIDPNGDLWYATSDFILARIHRVDAAGNDVEQRSIDGGKTIGAMSFAPWGGLYVSGGCDNNAFAFGGLTPVLPANEPYLMFLCRFKPDGTGDWAQFAHDITFQFPVVVTDDEGHAYVAGNVFDSTSWGGIPLQGPDWTSAMFLARADSTGQFLWGLSSAPAGGPITGDITAGVRGCLAVDGNGNPRITGTVRGEVVWGNGVASDAGTITDQAQTIVAFDTSGTPQWASTSAPTTYVTSHAVNCPDDGTLFFSGHATDEFGFPPFQTGAPGVQTYTVGRIDALSTVLPEVNDAASLAVHPVPTDAELFVLDPDGAMAFRLIAPSGAVVRQGVLDRGRNWLDLRGLAPGLYTLVTGNGRSARVVVH